MIFALYHNKKEHKLKILNWQKGHNIKREGFIVWNDNYILANERKILRYIAKDMKEKWIQETEKELNLLKDLKIETKY